MTAYYNEIDPFSAQWLRNLIAAGAVAPGVVDERDIRDVEPQELQAFTQVHMFAGIGVWSYALREAGWPDDRPVWTGSCPCQPFSAAGKGEGFSDERHLWPAWFHLIQNSKSRDVPVFGEQVASKDGLAWFDLVHADLEGEGHAVGSVDLCAAGAGADHIRQRLFFVADTNSIRRHPQPGAGLHNQELDPEPRGGVGRLAHAQRQGLEVRLQEDVCGAGRHEEGRQSQQSGDSGSRVWLPCRDGKTRPTQSGIFPLASRSPTHVGRLRGYGNAIYAPAAREFVAAYMTI